MKLFRFGIVILLTFFLGNLAAFACPLHSGDGVVSQEKPKILQ